MPFGIHVRLKKTKRYNVTGKNSYVVRIQLLDNTLLELTLTSESLGQECLNTIAQRLQLEETMYFGLQYINKGYKLRWVDLEKPLKKQLEKNSQDPILRFCVMLFASNIQQLRQEITRYLYFLQLKTDIIEGILPCSPEQAVLLASYAVQAEFGDFDPQRHTVEYLQDFVLLPKNLTSDPEILSDLIQEVINTYTNHVGMPPDSAELAYITETSHLEGYGQESYPAKDETGHELLLGASSIGIFVKHLTGQPTVTFKWSDIVNMGHNKRLFGIEMAHTEETVQFQMEDAETAKYVWRMCKLQQHFYKICLANTKPKVLEVSLDSISGFETNPQLNSNSSYQGSSIERRPTLLRHSELNEQINSNMKDVSSDESIPQMTAPDGPAFTQSQLSLDHQWGQDNHGQFTVSQLSLERPATANGNIGMTNHNGSVYSVNSANQAIPMQVSPTSSNLSLTGNEVIRANLQAALPAYRPSPDYNPNVHGQHIIMLNQDQSSSMGNLGASGLYMDSVLYQQPDIRQRSHTHGNHYRHQYRLSYGGLPSHHPGHFLESPPLHHMMHGPGNHATIIHTYSVPELTSHLQTTEEYIAAKLLKNKFRPPPPYPRGSTSTPDLARQNWQNYQVSSSSPDLVSRRLQHMLFHPVREVHQGLSSVESDMSTSSGNVAQSLPTEALQNLHINNNLRRPQDFGGQNLNMQVGQQQSFPQSPQHNVMHNSESTSPTEVSILQAPAGYEDTGNVFLPNGTYPIDTPVQSPSNIKDFHVPLVRPPSEFADTSDIESTMSPNSIGGPPRQFILPSHSQEMFPGTQTTVPESSTTTYASHFGHVKRRRQSSSSSQSAPNRDSGLHPSPGSLSPGSLSPGSLSPEMQELNMGHFAMQHIDRANIVDPSNGHPYQRDSGIVETALVGHSLPSPVDSPSTKLPPSSEDSYKPPPSLHASPEQAIEAVNGQSTSQESKLVETTPAAEGKEGDRKEYMGPLKLAAMSGLSLVRPRDRENEEEDNPRHPRDARRKILEEHLRDGQVFTEYELIPKKRSSAIFYTAQLPDNEQRNRFKDVLPYEDKRVELAPMHDNSTGFINASSIKLAIGGENCHYVAAQGPMENTVKDWWRMVWEKGIHVIAMLTKLKEGGKEKCFKYWPNCSSSKNTVEFGPFRIIGQFSNDSGCYITSGLTVRHIPSGEQRTVWHLQYTDWPNQGCPEDIHGYLAFVEEFQSVCRHANSINDKRSPPLVHCSAGVGRTGVLLLTDLMLNSLEHNEEINVPRMLERLRNQRMLMVQTVGQYIFVYRSLVQSLRNTRLI